MYYLEAPLEGLAKVQMCMDGGYCLGILLDYGSHSRTVGQYRYDREISSAYKTPFYWPDTEETCVKPSNLSPVAR